MKGEHIGLLSSSMLRAVIIITSLFISLVIVAYAEVVGWLTLVFISAAAVFALVLSACQ